MPDLNESVSMSMSKDFLEEGAAAGAALAANVSRRNIAKFGLPVYSPSFTFLGRCMYISHSLRSVRTLP
jgi:hypothetical protein